MKPSELEAALDAIGPTSTGWALACCRWNRAEAEEVLQIAALKILDGRAHFAGRASFRAFWFGVVRHTAAERRRREAVRLRFAARGDDASSPLPPPDPEQSTTRARQAEALRHALSELPRRQREVLHLVFYGGCSIEEAATAMGVRHGTARTHYERGKHNLRRRLPAEEDER